MSFTTGTTNYDLPQYVGTDTPSWTDTNEGFASLDSAVGGAVSTLSTVGDRVTALESTVNGEGGVTATITEIQGDITTLEGTVSGHTTSITNLGTEIDDVRSDCEDMITANEEASATSTTAYSVGDYFRYNDVLYKCTVNIGIGDTIVPNTNCTATNVMTELESVDSKDAEDIAYDNTDSGLTATDVQSAIDEVNSNLPKIVSTTVASGNATITIDNSIKYVDVEFVYSDSTRYDEISGLIELNAGAIVNGNVSIKSINRQDSNNFSMLVNSATVSDTTLSIPVGTSALNGQTFNVIVY